MQTTERTHPGGKPTSAQPQPLDDDVRSHGDVIFHRLIPKTRGQGKAGDDVGTAENIETQEMDETTEEAVEGHLYAWASNICHLEDTKVNVEDLSDRDIGPRLAQSTQELLSKILKCDAEEMQVDAYFRSEQHEGHTTEDFTVPSPLGHWRVCRKTYHDIDARDGPNSQYPKLAIAKRILAAAQAKAGPAPSDAQVKHVACRILAKRHVDLDDGVAEIKWPDLLHEAHEILYNHRGDATFQSRLEDELSGATERPASLNPELVGLVEKNLLKVRKKKKALLKKRKKKKTLLKKRKKKNNLLKGRKKKNKLHQFMVDEEASALCERVEGFDIVILRDGKHELICGVVAEAVQKLFPAETVDKMSTAAEAFAWRFPYKKPDEFRHPTSKAVHLAENPDKDVRSEECPQPHFAACGVEHYGVHHEVGHGRGFKGLCFKEFSSPQCRKLPKTSAWKEEFPKLRGGVYGVTAKVSRLALKALDPQLYEDYLEVRQHLPESLRATLATTGENPYGFMAQLIDTLTEGHRDWTDWKQGMAALTCFGNFTGGDLVLKELGVRIAFPSGSNCHLRGQGLHHLISRYEGIRHCLVLTNKESVRRTTDDLDERLKEETERAAKLESKDPQDWTDEEHELDKAYTEGKDAMLEYTWIIIKAELLQEKEDKAREKAAAAERKEADSSEETDSSEEADSSEEDDPDDPPKKKAKTAQ